MQQCENCGATVEKCGTATDGKKYCCIECVFNPLGCRCKYGEYGVAETQDWAALSGYEDDWDDDEGESFDDVEFTPCSNCDGHQACEDFGCAIAQGIISPIHDLPF